MTRRGFLGTVAAVAAGSGIVENLAQATEQKDGGAAMRALFERLDQPGQPGAALGIYHRGKVAHVSVHGRADLEHDIRVTPQTVFHIASVSKQFTAFAIALLAREGKLDLDADIRRYLSYVPDLGHPITTRQLVHHTSGLRDQWSLFALGGQEIRNVLRQQQVVNMVRRQKQLNFQPGAEYSYSNTGYTLMALIVAAVSGRSFRQFTSERIFAPLGMHSSFFYDDVTELVPKRAHSYERRDATQKWRRSLLNYETVGATSLHTTVEDLLKWAANFARPTVGDAALIEQICTSGSLRDGRSIAYGFGLERTRIAGHEAVAHTGWDAGFRSLFAYFPKSELGIVLLRNSMDAAENNMVSEDLFGPARAVANAYLNQGRDPDASGALAVSEPSAETLREVAGIYLHEFDRHLTLEASDAGLVMKRGSARGRIVFRADGSFDLGNRQAGFYRLLRSGGKVTRFERYTDEAGVRPPMVYQRIDKSTPSLPALAALAGEYRCDELEVTYRLEAADGHLRARSLWAAEPADLMPLTADRFESSSDALHVVTFQRNAQRGVSGFRAHSGRIRNVWFQKI